MSRTLQMAKIIRLSADPAFQEVYQGLLEQYKNKRASKPSMFGDMRISGRRIVAAAIMASDEVAPSDLLKTYKQGLMPSHRFKEDEVAGRGTVLHVPLLMLDHIKMGTARMNIAHFGPLEDKTREAGDRKARIRLTERQYLHLIICYLKKQNWNTKLLAIRASEEIYPIKWSGMTANSSKNIKRGEGMIDGSPELRSLVDAFRSK